LELELELELLLFPPPPPKPPKKKNPPPPPPLRLEHSSVGDADGLGEAPDAEFVVPAVPVALVELVALEVGSALGSQSALLLPPEQAERRISRAVAPPIAAILCLGARAPRVVVVAMSASS
jgi:hypothetical protein